MSAAAVPSNDAKIDQLKSQLKADNYKRVRGMFLEIYPNLRMLAYDVFEAKVQKLMSTIDLDKFVDAMNLNVSVPLLLELKEAATRPLPEEDEKPNEKPDEAAAPTLHAPLDDH